MEIIGTKTYDNNEYHVTSKCTYKEMEKKGKHVRKPGWGGQGRHRRRRRRKSRQLNIVTKSSSFINLWYFQAVRKDYEHSRYFKICREEVALIIIKGYNITTHHLMMKQNKKNQKMTISLPLRPAFSDAGVVKSSISLQSPSGPAISRKASPC